MIFAFSTIGWVCKLKTYMLVAIQKHILLVYSTHLTEAPYSWDKRLCVCWKTYETAKTILVIHVLEMYLGGRWLDMIEILKTCGEHGLCILKVLYVYKMVPSIWCATFWNVNTKRMAEKCPTELKGRAQTPKFTIRRCGGWGRQSSKIKPQIKHF